MEGLEKEIKELYAKRAALRSEEKQITGKIKELKLKYIEKKYGFKIGSIITDKSRKTYKITDIDVWDLDMYPHMFKANLMRKDGTFGTQIRNLWLYENGIKLSNNPPPSAWWGLLMRPQAHRWGRSRKKRKRRKKHERQTH